MDILTNVLKHLAVTGKLSSMMNTAQENQTHVKLQQITGQQTHRENVKRHPGAIGLNLQLRNVTGYRIM